MPNLSGRMAESSTAPFAFRELCRPVSRTETQGSRRRPPREPVRVATVARRALVRERDSARFCKSAQRHRDRLHPDWFFGEARLPHDRSCKLGHLARVSYGALLSVVLVWTIAVSAKAADSYFFDKEHSEIRFYYSHGGVSEQSGEFTSFEGDVVFDEEKFDNSSVSIKIDAKSASSGVAHLDGQLKNPYYFSAKDHPKITFESASVRQVGSKNAIILGNLTIRGVTKPVELDVELRHKGEHPLGKSLPFYKGKWIGIYATASLLRSDFGMDSLIPVVSDRVSIVINAELKARKK